MIKRIKDLLSQRLIILLWLFAVGGVASWADDTSSSGGSNTQTEELIYDFTNAEGQALISGLAGNPTQWTADNQTLTIQVKGYPITYHNCLRNTSYLNIRGDYSDNNSGHDPGYIKGTMTGTLTAVKITKNNGGTSTGKLTVEIELNDGTIHTVESETMSAKGDYTINIPTNMQVQNAKSISLKPNFQLRASQIVMVRIPEPLDTSKDLLIFKKKNGTEYPSIKDDATVYEAPAGQILQLKSFNEERLDPVSTPGNGYVVTYTIDGSEPQFVYKKDSNGNWQDTKTTSGDKTSYSYVYRRGIVLDASAGSEVNVKVGIFQLDKDATDGTSATALQTISKTFQLTSGNSRPAWNNNQKDITFSPRTLYATSSNTYVQGMAVMDPTETVTATASSHCFTDTIIAKFSSDTHYNLQQLLNVVNVTPRLKQANMTSSQMKLRMISAMLYTPDGIASEAVAEAYYWYIPTRTKLGMEATITPGEMSIAEGSNIKQAKIELRAYTTSSDNTKTYIDLTELNLTKENITFSDSFVAKLVTSTDAPNGITYSDDKKTAYITIEGLENGTTDITIQSAKTSNVDVDNDTKQNYTVASATVSVSVVGGNTIMPPTIDPYTTDYNKTFQATVKGYEGVKTYYILHFTPTESQDVPSIIADGETSGAEGGETSESDIEDLKDEAFLEAWNKIKNDPSYNVNNEYAAGMIEGGNTASLEIPAEINNHYALLAMAVKEEATEGDNSTTTKTYSRVVKSIYTYNTLEAPVLSPGVEGLDNYYPFEGGNLTVEAHVNTANTLIFYTHDRNATFTVEDGNISATEGAWQIYDVRNHITVDKSMYVRAVAFNDSLRMASDIVEYRYAKIADNVEAPTFHIGEAQYNSGAKYVGAAPSIQLQAILYDAEGNQQTIGGSKVDWANDKYHIYYTTDGSYPNEYSKHYTEAFTPSFENGNDVIEIIAGVYANGTGGDYTMSEISSFYIFNNSGIYWEANGTTCPNGVLASKTATLGDGTNTLMNIEFGNGEKNSDLTWKHYTSREHATGDPIDNIGYYTITPADDTQEKLADVKDEAGNLWNHSKANNGQFDFQTHKATFGLPASGAYVKFEPKKSGKLTVWCCQEGALYYNNNINPDATKFNSEFIRKRPMYFIDEAGNSIKPASIYAAGTLSSNWDTEITSGSWKAKGDTQNNITQDLYTADQQKQIYEMFNGVIMKKKADYRTSLNDGLIFYLNTKENKTVAGFNVSDDPGRKEGDATAYVPDNNVDSTGICLPSASFMKYTFDVKAGKTYFFFGWMTKIGIRGFGFEPSTEEALTDAPTIYSGSSATGNGGNSDENNFTGNKGKTYASVTLNRSFTSGTWTTLVLPFSVSASQVEDVFGKGTQILHYRTIENRTMYFFQHFHQMIVAGTPILIKPTNSFSGTNLPTFTNVTFESATVTDTPCNDYGYVDANGNVTTENTTWKMVGAYARQHVADYNYYINNAGLVKRLINDGKGNDLNGTRAYIVGTTGSDNQPAAVTSMAKAAFDNLIPENMSGETTDIDFIETSDGGNGIIDGNVYSLDGQLVRKQGESLKGLNKGVYIVNGKKVVVQ